MQRRNLNQNQPDQTLEQILTVTRQLFILEALKAGMSTEAVRKLLKIDYWRVIEISKQLKQSHKKATKD